MPPTAYAILLPGFFTLLALTGAVAVGYLLKALAPHPPC